MFYDHASCAAVPFGPAVATTMEPLARQGVLAAEAHDGTARAVAALRTAS